MSKELNDLQSQLSFHEQYISELNDVIIKQQKDIKNLQDQIKYLFKQFKSLSAHMRTTNDQEQPPHY